MKGVTRLPLSLPGTRRTLWAVNIRPTPDGRLRPRGALQQPGAAVEPSLRSVGGSRRSGPCGGRGGANETPPLEGSAAYRVHRDNVRWAVWLGRHTPEKIAGVPKGRLRRVRTPP